MTNKRQRTTVPKPVTVLQLWRQVQQKQFAIATGTARVPAPIRLLPTTTIPHDTTSHNNNDWLRLGTGVYELSGEAGSGKTQIALSLCQRLASSTTIPDAAGPTSLYLSLGAGRLPKALQRLQQMSESSLLSSSSLYNDHAKNPWLFRILTKAILNRDDWKDFLREADTFFTRHGETLRLVVVDSLADLVRDDFGQYTHFDRTAWLLAWVQRCQVLADQYQLTWLLINQQTTSVVTVNGVWGSKPALGVAWAHAVQGSWMCHRGTPRKLSLYKSNRHAVAQTAYFTIEQGGVQCVQPLLQDEEEYNNNVL
jgi:hypothetical protein